MWIRGRCDGVASQFPTSYLSTDPITLATLGLFACLLGGLGILFHVKKRRRTQPLANPLILAPASFQQIGQRAYFSL